MSNMTSVTVSTYDLGRLDQWCHGLISSPKPKYLSVSLRVCSSVATCFLRPRQISFGTS
jgi:hypothetical protein